MIPAYSYNPGGGVISRYECANLGRGSRGAIKYGLRQALLAMLIGFRKIMLELMRKRGGLPAQDQGREQPD